MLRWLALLSLVAGCGSRCHEVAAARTALTSRTGAPDRGADLRVTVPFARANALVDDLLRAQPLAVPLELPRLPIAVTTGLTATAVEVRLQPGEPGTIAFAIAIDIADADARITTMHVRAAVTPVLTRADGAAELSIGFGPDNLLAIRPELGPDARGALGAAVARWLPANLRGKVPQALLDVAAEKVGSYLVGAAYDLVRRTLLARVGEVTRLRLHLPDVPIATTAIRSTADALFVDVTTDLPVRRGLASTGDAGDDLAVQLSGSAVAELANWAIDRGHAPRWYTRSLAPRADGEFRPRFDYVADDTAHPFKVYAFQERGGCSYFRVGVRAAIALRGGRLEVTALDRALEAKSASPVIEAAAWVKYFLTGSIDRSKQIAATTRLTVGGRTLATEVVGASLAGDELRFELGVENANPSADSRRR